MSEFFYDPVQHEAEDYDLWLRMSAKGIQFLKISNALLLHRIRKESFTRRRQNNIFAKNFRVKMKFVFHQILNNNFSFYTFKIFLIGLIDIVLASIKEVKKYFKNVIKTFKFKKTN